ncbi:hypothetical protein [Terriglobus sp. ADX1]|uniref:hypothetical protein n=1 Tax=Terriglobus sp. ADX1 TaxID=2794063 RepID=UPI002FE51467
MRIPQISISPAEIVWHTDVAILSQFIQGTACGARARNAHPRFDFLSLFVTAGFSGTAEVRSHLFDVDDPS